MSEPGDRHTSGGTATEEAPERPPAPREGALVNLPALAVAPAEAP